MINSLVNAIDVPSSLNLFTLTMEAIHSSENFLLTGSARCHIPECGIIHSHSFESPKSYIALTS
jgi:hypothetical protein